MAEIRQDLRRVGVREITVLIQLPGHAYLESYFKKKYSKQQVKLGTLTEYFNFDDSELREILEELNRLLPPAESQALSRVERIKRGMARARSQGMHVGRPKRQETDDQFLAKAESRQIISLLDQHPEWSLRMIAQQSGKAINTVCKVNQIYRKLRPN